jgi:hypothetical protein
MHVVEAVVERAQLTRDEAGGVGVVADPPIDALGSVAH